MRDGVWPHRALWGDEKESVRDYLKKVYLELHRSYSRQSLTHDNVKEEAKKILQVNYISK